MRKFMTWYCLTTCAVLLTLLLLASCVRGGVTGADATATFGAEQWRAQLTAMEAER